ncbi:unnamed protein product [Prunus brigantina]
MVQWTRAEKRTFLRQRVEARLASLLMESKEYSEALSLLSGLITEVRRLDDKLLLVDIDLLENCQCISSSSLVFVVVSELKHQTPGESFHCTLSFHFSLFLEIKHSQTKKEGLICLKKNGGKELGMVTPQDKSLKKMKFVSSA